VPRLYNAAEALLARNRAHPTRVAVTDDRGSTTFGELEVLAARAAKALRGLGLEPEQRVMLCLQDSVEFHACFLGAMLLGALPVPINTLLTTEDYSQLLADSRARLLVVSAALYPKLRDAVKAAPSLTAVIIEGDSIDGHPALGVLMDQSSSARPQLLTTPDDVAFWLYSSGSTGRAKGVMHLHGSLEETARLYGEAVLGVRADDVIFSAAKLFFAYGLGNALTFPLFAGARSVLRRERPTPASVLKTLAEEKVTIFCGVPTLFAAMLADRAPPPPLALRCCISAGEALPEEVGRRFRERFGVDILDGIGSTEMLHIFISNRHGQVRYGASGQPVAGYEAQLRNEAGEVLNGQAEGLLWVKGPSAAVGYWNNRARSLETFHGPWTRTGDNYARLADGTYVYSGRSDDMLKVGGIWVSPFEVESALLCHAAVLECAVVGHADEAELVKPKAFVVLKVPGQASPALADELKLFVKEKLAPYKYPRWVEFVAELPKTATGKIQRFRLRRSPTRSS